MATVAASTGASEATITFHNEQWTAESARLMLEVDEGWVGYRGDAAWSWHNETYTVYTAICQERKWPCNSKAACKAMLHALRTGAISMNLSSATRSSDGCAQWSLAEMRELGARMRRVVDGKSQTARWPAQLVAFVNAMKTKHDNYSIDLRTVEDFAARAGKFVPPLVLRLIDPPRTATKAKRTHRTPTPEPEQRTRRVTRGQSTATEDSDDEPLLPRRKTQARTTTSAASSTTGSTRLRKGRKRSAESDGDNSYHDPTSEDEDMLWDASLGTSDNSVPTTQEVTSQGELLPAADEQPTASIQDQARPSLPQDAPDERRPQSATSQTRASPRDDPTASRRASPREDSKRTSPRQEESVQQRATPRQDEPVLQRASPRQEEPVQQRATPRQDTARLANGNQNGTSSRQPTRKYQRTQQPVVNDRMNSNCRASNSKTSPPLFRSLNPYDRPGKPWGEFVVEVLLAERTARNEDELDYVQFVRGLYEI